MISAVPTSETFRERNFTSEEIKYCTSAPDPTASFAGRWAAKEAVVRFLLRGIADNQFKALSVPSKGAGASMKDIEILTSETGPNVRWRYETSADKQVKLTGDALSAAGGKTIKVSLSHSDTSVVAFAVAQ